MSPVPLQLKSDASRSNWLVMLVQDLEGRNEVETVFCLGNKPGYSKYSHDAADFPRSGSVSITSFVGVKMQLWHAMGTEQMLLTRALRRQQERDRLQELLELLGRMKAVEYYLLSTVLGF